MVKREIMTVLRWLIFFFFYGPIVACNTARPKPYFDFDEVIHYAFDISEEDATNILSKEIRTTNDSALHYLLFNEDNPKTVNDATFLKDVHRLASWSVPISEKYLNELANIFSDTQVENVYDYSCIYIYRDILVFKRDHKVVGIAKICLGCHANVIIGTSTHTGAFGQNGDYERLATLIHKNSGK